MPKKIATRKVLHLDKAYRLKKIVQIKELEFINIHTMECKTFLRCIQVKAPISMGAVDCYLYPNPEILKMQMIIIEPQP